MALEQAFKGEKYSVGAGLPATAVDQSIQQVTETLLSQADQLPHFLDPISIQAMSRSSRRRIFPTGVIGNDSLNTICLGTLYPVKLALQYAFSSSRLTP